MMRDWLTKFSAGTASNFLFWLIGGVGFSALVYVYQSWDYFIAAPWPFRAVVTIALTLVFGFGVFLIFRWLHAPVEGQQAPKHLKRFKWPIGRLSWDFDGYIGWGGSAGVPLQIYALQPRLRVNRGDGVKPIRAYIENSNTGKRRDILVSCGEVGGQHRFKRVEEIEHIPAGVWLQCFAWFTDTMDTSTTKIREAVLHEFPGFEFVFEYEGGAFRRHFSRAEMITVFDRCWYFSNPEPMPSVRIKNQLVGSSI